MSSASANTGHTSILNSYLKSALRISVQQLSKLYPEHLSQNQHSATSFSGPNKIISQSHHSSSPKRPRQLPSRRLRFSLPYPAKLFTMLRARHSPSVSFTYYHQPIFFSPRRLYRLSSFILHCMCPSSATSPYVGFLIVLIFIPDSSFSAVCSIISSHSSVIFIFIPRQSSSCRRLSHSSSFIIAISNPRLPANSFFKSSVSLQYVSLPFSCQHFSFTNDTRSLPPFRLLFASPDTDRL